MQAVYARLVRRKHGLIQLLDPAFDKSELDPAYIRGYVPGVRENSGPYTHPAIWTVMPFAQLARHATARGVPVVIYTVNQAPSTAPVSPQKQTHRRDFK